MIAKEKAMVPELRFPTFKEDWGAVPLRELANRKVDKNTDSEVSRVLTNSATKGVVDQADYFDKGIANLNNLGGYYLVDVGDYVYNPRISVSAPVGPINKNKLGKGVMSPLYSVFRFSKTENDFYEIYFKSSHWHRYMCHVANYGARHDRMNITMDDFMNLPLPVVGIKEQQKIASFLTAVDDKLNLLRRKRDGLQTYKRGVMQQLFSQTLRFKQDDGSDFPDWEEKKANELFKNHSNKNHNSDLPILSVTQENGVVNRDGVGIDIKTSVQSIESYKVIEKGDFVISLRSFQGGIEYSNVLGISSPAYTVLKPKLDIVDDFYRVYFKKEDFISKLSSTVIGIRDGKQISYDSFSILKLPYPSLKEQEKISNFITAIERKISTVSQQINQTETFKKGLLQKMFV